MLILLIRKKKLNFLMYISNPLQAIMNAVNENNTIYLREIFQRLQDKKVEILQQSNSDGNSMVYRFCNNYIC